MMSKNLNGRRESGVDEQGGYYTFPESDEPNTKYRIANIPLQSGTSGISGTSHYQPKITKEMEILEGNKLIAEFMGLSLSGGQYKFPTGNGCSIIDYQKYHSSWEWLMPVVEKIENECAHEVVIFGDHCHINQGETHDMGYTSKGSKLESTYQAVIEFIKWYNTQK